VLFAHVQQCDEVRMSYRGSGTALPPPLAGKGPGGG
jgi:hypothetical protein